MVEAFEMLIDRVKELQAGALFNTVFLWIILSVVAGVLAAGKGREGWSVFALSLILSPVIGLITAAALQDHRKRDIQKLKEQVAALVLVGVAPATGAALQPDVSPGQEGASPTPTRGDHPRSMVAAIVFVVMLALLIVWAVSINRR